jgi:hypothetical protein
MLIARLAAEVVGAPAFNANPYIAAGIAFAVFLTLGIVAWSYRDVYNRHSDKTGNGHDSHTAGH